jgi:hypothetical protein
MENHDKLSKFPVDSSDRDYDLFEELPGGSTVWRGCVFGMATLERRLQELAQGSDHNFFALCFLDRGPVFIRPHSVTQASSEKQKRSA